MLVIQTSYYSNPRIKTIDNKFRLVGISLKIPEWFEGETFRQLAPTYEILKFKNDREKYTKLYKQKILNALNPIEIAKILNNSILLCWEKSGSFCHRRIVAEWLGTANNIEVPEYSNVDEPTLSLF